MRIKKMAFMPALILSLIFLVPEFASAQSEGPRMQYEPEIGQPHFDFALPLIANHQSREKGQPVYLSQLRGQKVLLIHFASW